MTIEVRVAHTSDLDQPTRDAAVALLYDVFPDMKDSDWEHACGGMHALAYAGGELVGHASVIQRRLVHGGRALRTGYVEAVGVRADRRGQGYGAALMDPIERIIRTAYDLGALSASTGSEAFYTGRGWTQWLGPTSEFTPRGVRRSPDEDGGVYVLELGVPLDLSAGITADWRDYEVW